MSALDFTARALALRATQQIKQGGSVILNGARADGQADDAAALNGFIAHGGFVDFPQGDYRVGTTLEVSSDTHIRMAPGARLLPGTANTTMVSIQGTAPAAWVALTSNIAKGAKTWTHTSGAYSVGQWVEFRSNALCTSGPNAGIGSKIACVRKIVKKTGTGPYTYTLNKGVLDHFNTADSAEVGMPTMVENVILENLTLNRENYTTHISYGIYLRYCANVRIINPTIIGSKDKVGADVVSPDGIKVNYGCFGVEIENPMLKHLGWYGISVAGEQVRIWGGFAEDVRHAVSIVYTPYGEPTDVLVNGMTANNTTLSAFDAHDTGRDIVFDNCVANGAGDDGFQFRTNGVRARGCTARGSAVDGFSDGPGATGHVLIGCVADANGRIGYNFTGRAHLTDCDALANTNASGGAMQLQSGGAVRGGRFTGNGNVFRIYDAPLLVEGVHAPADATQTLFATAITGVGGRFNKVQFRNNHIPGYANNALFPRQQAARTAGDLPPITSGNILSDGAAGAEWSGEATLVGGAVTVATTAAKRVTAINWAEDIVCRVDLRRVTPGGTVGDLYVESGTSGTGFGIRSTSAADTSKVRWTVEL